MIDKVLISLIRWSQLVGAVVGLALTGIYFTEIIRELKNVPSAICGIVLYCLHILIFYKYKKNKKLWIFLSIVSVLFQSFYIYTPSMFCYRFVIAFGFFSIFRFESLSFKAFNITLSDLTIGFIQKESIEGWGINIVAVVILLYLVYYLLKYFYNR